MHIIEAIRIALNSLWANKLRSVLTLLGVVIGVAAVIAVVTFVNGINGYVANRIFRLGADVFIIQKFGIVRNVDEFMEAQRRKNLDMDDYRAVAESCSHCKEVGAAYDIGNGRVNYSNQNATDVNVKGRTASMAIINDVDLANGRYVNETDEENASSVAVIGNDILDNLMAGVDPIGKEIRIDGRIYTVIGVGKT